MAQTRRKRKRRGTQGGKVDDRPRGRPRSREEAKARAKAQRRRGAPRQRTTGPPTWRGAIFKGLVASVIFFALIALLLKQPVGTSAGLAGFMLLFYIPMTYVTDRFFYQRNLRKAERERIARAQRDTGDG
jgi:hypothetical protein